MNDAPMPPRLGQCEKCHFDICRRPIVGIREGKRYIAGWKQECMCSELERGDAQKSLDRTLARKRRYVPRIRQTVGERVRDELNTTQRMQ